MAKIESDAVGPESEEEKVALGVAWTYLERTLEMYNSAETFLHDSQGRVKFALKEMEAEMQAFSGPEEEAQRAKEAVKTIKEFKAAQADKIDALQEQISRVQKALEVPRNVIGAVLEENNTSQDLATKENSEAQEESEENQGKKKNKSKKGKK